VKNYTLGLYEKSMPHNLTLREKLFNAKISGFDFLEVSIDETDEKLSRLRWSKEKLREVSDAIAESGTPIGSMCLSGHRKFPLGSMSETVRNESLDIMKRAIELSSFWGIRTIQLAGYDVYYEESNEKTGELFIENLAKSVDLATKAGVVLAFETMETPFMDTVEKAMFFVNKVNSPYLQVYPDLGNLTNAASLYGHDISADLQCGRGHVVALHLKETEPGKYRDVSYGSGKVDFALGVETAKALGVRRFVGEFWDDGNFQAQIDHAYTFLRSYLD